MRKTLNDRKLAVNTRLYMIKRQLELYWKDCAYLSIVDIDDEKKLKEIEIFIENLCKKYPVENIPKT